MEFGFSTSSWPIRSRAERQLVQVDFCQLGSLSLEKEIVRLAEMLIAEDQRLLILSSDEAQIARLDRTLWDQGPASFIPHAIAGGADDSRQPILLSTTADAANRARNLLIADGEWRPAALGFDRAFYLFDSGIVQQARAAWRSLAGGDGLQLRYLAFEDGKWEEKASSPRKPE